MKEILIAQDIKGISTKKHKGAKKSSGVDFASLLFNDKNSKNTKNLLTLQNVFKAKNSVLNKDLKPQNSANIDILLNNIEKKSSKKDMNILANLLQNPTKAKVEKIVNDAKEINEFLPKRLQISEAEIMQDITKTLNDTDYGKELLDDLNLVQVLDFLDILKQDKKDVSLNSFFNLKDVINNKASIESFANTKNIHELIKLAKEHDLGIKKISYEKIENNEYNEEIFKKPYPKLFEQNFFAHSIKKDIEKNKIVENNKPIKLENLLNEKDAKIITKETIIQDKSAEKTLKSGALNDLLSEVAKKESKENSSSKEINIKDLKNTTEKQIDKPVINKNNDGFKEVLKETELKTPNLPNEIHKINSNEKVNQTEAIKMKIENPKPQEAQNTGVLEQINTNEELNINTDNKDIQIEKPNLVQTLKVDVFNPNKDLNKEQIRQVFDDFNKDFKEELEKFKAPNHRVKISLNPKELGEINVTMIARGNNLHINLNSANTNTLNLFIANQQEFKNSLVNMGFTGIAMNFGDKKEGNQQDQQQKNARKKYEEIEELEATSDMPSGINAIIYRYL